MQGAARVKCIRHAKTVYGAIDISLRLPFHGERSMHAIWIYKEIPNDQITLTLRPGITARRSSSNCPGMITIMKRDSALWRDPCNDICPSE